MSYLKIYLQDVLPEGEGTQDISDLKKYFSEYHFDIGSILNSCFSQVRSAEDGVDSDKFHVFGLEQKLNIGESYLVQGNIIAVCKRLKAYVRTEWMTERDNCVWVTVPSHRCLGTLHVACVDLLLSPNIDSFTKTLTSLGKTYASDKFLVVGRIPFIYSVSHAGLTQFNNINNSNNDVLSSVPVTVMRCPHPFVPEKQIWKIALEFWLNIGPSEFCKTGEDCANEPSGQREPRREDANASGDSSTIIDWLVHTKWDEKTKLRIEKIEERLRTLEERARAHWKRSGFRSTGSMSPSPFTTPICEPAGGWSSDAAPAFGSTALGLFGASSAPRTRISNTSGASGPMFEGSSGQQTLSFSQSNPGPFFGNSTHTGFFSQPSTSVQNAVGGEFGFTSECIASDRFGNIQAGGFVSTGTQTTFGKPAGKEAFGAAAVFGSTPAGNTPQLIEHCVGSEEGLFEASLCHQDFGQSNTGALFDQLRTSTQTGFDDKPVDGDMEASAIISIADSTLTTSSSQIIRKQTQNKTESQNVETLFKKGTAEVTPTTLSKPAAKAALQKLLASATAFGFYSNLKATLVSDSSFNPDAITMPLILFNLVFKQVIVPELL